jgi:hypothetical protein
VIEIGRIPRAARRKVPKRKMSAARRSQERRKRSMGAAGTGTTSTIGTAQAIISTSREIRSTRRVMRGTVHGRRTRCQQKKKVGLAMTRSGIDTGLCCNL